jgi:hypothetical protein
MSYCGLPEDEQEVIAKAARLVSGKWDTTTEQILNGFFLETASHSSRAGANAHENWCASMLALGKTCIAIAEREKRVHKP